MRATLISILALTSGVFAIAKPEPQIVTQISDGQPQAPTEVPSSKSSIIVSPTTAKLTTAVSSIAVPPTSVPYPAGNSTSVAIGTSSKPVVASTKPVVGTTSLYTSVVASSSSSTGASSSSVPTITPAKGAANSLEVGGSVFGIVIAGAFAFLA